MQGLRDVRSPAEIRADASADSPLPVLWMVEDLGERAGGPVPYERVVQTARRELLMDRTAVETAVEALCDRGDLGKVRADYLRPTGSP